MDEDLVLRRAHGTDVFTYEQGLAALGRYRFLRAIRCGTVVRVRRGLYELPGAGETLIERFLKLQSYARCELVACGPTAAELHGFPYVHDSRLHVTLLSGASFVVPVGVIGRQKVARSVVRTVAGILATDPAETTIDLARAAPSPNVLQMLDAGRRSGIEQDELLSAATEATRSRGIVAVRQWIPWSSPLSESPPESWVRQGLLTAGLTDVQLQVPLRSGRTNRRSDLGWKEFKVGVEYDGEDFHTGNGSLSRDRARLAEFAQEGWSLHHAVKTDLGRLDRFAHRIRFELLSRGWSPPDIDPPVSPRGRRGQLPQTRRRSCG